EEFSSADGYFFTKLYNGDGIFLNYWNLNIDTGYIKSPFPGEKEGISGSTAGGYNVGINSYINSEHKKYAIEANHMYDSLYNNKTIEEVLDKIEDILKVYKISLDSPSVIISIHPYKSVLMTYEDEEEKNFRMCKLNSTFTLVMKNLFLLYKFLILFVFLLLAFMEWNIQKTIYDIKFLTTIVFYFIQKYTKTEDEFEAKLGKVVKYESTNLKSVTSNEVGLTSISTERSSISGLSKKILYYHNRTSISTNITNVSSPQDGFAASMSQQNVN
ncbi:hypothetical protein PIROE2DRAFT_1714, partial [Piromyces sp. E2]